MIKHHKAPRLIAISLIASSLALAGCSGDPTDDVRLTFCKGMAAQLLKPATAMDLDNDDIHVKASDEVIISVELSVDGKATNATCYYQYDQENDNVMGGGGELAAFDTVPYKMTLNSQMVEETRRNKAVQAALLQQGKDTIKQVNKKAGQAVEAIKKKADEAAEALQQ